MKHFLVAFLILFSTLVSGHERSQIHVPDLIHCVDEFRDVTLRVKDDPSFLPFQYLMNEDGFGILVGMLGYHATWAVLTDFKASPPKAFETFEGSGVWGRMYTPHLIRLWLEECGAVWQGSFKGHPPEIIRPNVKQSIFLGPSGLSSEAGQDLLPPKRRNK